MASIARFLPGMTSIMLAAALLSGCAQTWSADAQRAVDQMGSQRRSSGAAPAAICEGETLPPADNTRLAAIEQLVGEGKPYAAIAQLDALGSNVTAARIVRADALRRIDRDAEARAVYQGLLGSCMDGRAQHGLGLIAARAGQQDAAIGHLQKARAALPTDPRIRNDLGYALLLAGQWDAAEFEFLTALELRPQDPLVSRNIVLLRFRQGLTERAVELARQFELDDATTQRLRQQALTLGGVRPPQPAPPTPSEQPAAVAPPAPAASAGPAGPGV